MFFTICMLIWNHRMEQERRKERDVDRKASEEERKTRAEERAADRKAREEEYAMIRRRQEEILAQLQVERARWDYITARVMELSAQALRQGNDKSTDPIDRG